MREVLKKSDTRGKGKRSIFRPLNATIIFTTPRNISKELQRLKMICVLVIINTKTGNADVRHFMNTS